MRCKVVVDSFLCHPTLELNFKKGFHMKFFVASLLIFAVSTSFSAQNFIFCMEGSPSSFNPQLVTDGVSMNSSAQTIFNRLVEFKYGTTEIEPGLAESWTVSKDKKTFTFKLRKNVPFHSNANFTPTRTFNADDVVYTFKLPQEEIMDIEMDAYSSAHLLTYDSKLKRSCVEYWDLYSRLRMAKRCFDNPDKKLKKILQ